jgi:LPXTG-motif cell wall-anchored protein
MACGAKVGHVTEASVGLARTGIAGSLLRVPGKVGGSSTTALERGARTVATSGVTLGGFELLGDAVRVRVLRAPSLLAGMSAAAGGEVRYVPAVIEVSGDGLETTRLDTAGDDVEIALGDDRSDSRGDPAGPGTDDSAGPGAGNSVGPGGGDSARSGTDDSARSGAGDSAGPGARDGKPGAADGRGADGDGPAGIDGKPASSGDEPAMAGDHEPVTRSKRTADDGQPGGTTPNAKARAEGKAESTTIGELVSRLPKLGGLTGGSPLPIPAVPGVPPVSDPDTESARVTGPGTRLRITLGDVRQAASGHAIAARATAIKITITQSKTGYGDSAPNRSGVILDLDLGVLEAAAVAPEPSGTGVHAGAGVHAVTAGGADGLPITGPRTDVFAIVGAGLMLAGATALLVGRRRRRLRVEP